MQKVYFVILGIVLFGTSNLKSQPQAKSGYQLSSSEKSLIENIGFDKSILETIRLKTSSAAEQFYLAKKVKLIKGKQVESEKVFYKALLFRVDKANANLLVDQLGKSLFRKGYLIFKTEGNLRSDLYKVVILKTKDQFEVLKIMGTNAFSYGHDVNWVIAYSKDIFNKYPFRIIGADIDWLEAEFTTPPSDLIKLAKELKKDCPDIFDDEIDNTNEVAQRMKQSNKLYLMWE